MFISSISPIGVVSCLNLARVPIWRLELAVAGGSIGIGLRYITGAQTSPTSVAMLVGLDVGSLPAAEMVTLTNIAKIGLPKHTVEGDVERLMEAMKALYNSSLKPAEVENLIAHTHILPEHYHRILRAVATEASDAAEALGWRWSVGSTPIATQHLAPAPAPAKD